VIFLTPFCENLSEKWSIEIYRKTGPTKSTVLGPRPPPWENDENYRNLLNFNDFGAFNTAGKSVSKIGIYALPPSKSEFYGKFIDFLIYRDSI
jgi:sugar/nucleoside kinase (ribokinase family)